LIGRYMMDTWISIHYMQLHILLDGYLDFSSLYATSYLDGEYTVVHPTKNNINVEIKIDFIN